ncbi:hypothetical protein ACYQR9_04565 [Methylobacterium sp. CM6241]|nr:MULTISPECIES: hypothetical protein [unclassified Methylobacterium]
MATLDTGRRKGRVRVDGTGPATGPKTGLPRVAGGIKHGMPAG